MKILLVHAYYAEILRNIYQKTLSSPPLGLMYIKAFLREHGYKEIEIIDLMVEGLSNTLFSKKLKELDPTIVGFSVYCESYGYSLELAKKVKEIKPNTVIVFGGSFPTFMPRDVLKFPQIDYVVMGEGEESFLELVSYLSGKKKQDVENISGIAYRKEGRVFVNKRREPIKDLDQLPFLDYSALNLTKYNSPFTISTCRGCPSRCIFCSSQEMWGNRVRFRSAKHVFAEVTHLVEQYHPKLLKRIYFIDDTFTANPWRAIEFCKLMKGAPFKIPWYCESRVDTVDAEILGLMAEAGCYSVQFGVETGVQEVLDRLGKGIRLEQAEKAIRSATSVGMKVACSFILGHAVDTMETMRRTLDYADYLQEKLGVYNIHMSLNTPFPGTYQHENAERIGLKIETREWSNYTLKKAVISTDNFSSIELQNMLMEYLKRVYSAAMTS